MLWLVDWVASPCERVKPPKATTVDQKFLTDAQVQILLEACRSEAVKYRAILDIALYGGMRRGEIVGLHWGDIDSVNRTITINRTRKFIRGVGYIDKDTKTATSHRTIILPQSVFALLAELKIEQNSRKVELGTNWVETPHIFKPMGWRGHDG